MDSFEIQLKVKFNLKWLNLNVSLLLQFYVFFGK
jgi:hypothetical protein